MRNIRSKKVVNPTNKYLLGPFDDSLVQIQLDKNQKCISEINKGNFERAQQFLKQIKKDGQMISSYNREKYVVKCVTLNTQSYYYQKQNRYQQALKCLEESQFIEEKQITSPIEKARTKLNKSLVLSNLKKNQQAIQLAKRALEMLKNNKNLQIYEIHKNQYKLYEIMISSFHNIATSMSQINNGQQAKKLFKQGYYLAQKFLGSTHKLTKTLKNIVKQNRNRQKLRMSQKDEILQNQVDDLKSNRSLQKSKSLDRSKMKHQLLSKDKRQQELKRIYTFKSRKNMFESLSKRKNKKISYVNEASMQKIKIIENQKHLKYTKILRISTDITYKSKLNSRKKNKKMKSKDSLAKNRYSLSSSHQHQSLYLPQLYLNNSQSKIKKEKQMVIKSSRKSVKNQNQTQIQKLNQVPFEEIIDNKQINVQLVIEKVEDKIKQQNKQCQLI